MTETSILDNNIEKFDWIILGAGSGGLSLLEAAAPYNKKCLIIDPKQLGGTCVNVGCVPKKILWNLDETYSYLKLSKGFGLTVKKEKFNYQELLNNQRTYIQNINNWYLGKVKDWGGQLIQGYGEFVAPHIIQVNGQQYYGENILIATGGYPDIPKDISGYEYGITSNEFFALNEIPKSITVVGSGYIALELASVMATLQKLEHDSVNVHIIVRTEQVLRSMDEMFSAQIIENLSNKGITFHFNSSVKSITKSITQPTTQPTTKSYFDGELEIVKTSTKDESIDEKSEENIIVSQTLLWAIGRSPNIESLNVSKANIKTTHRNQISIDDYFETSEPKHFAIGDITNHPQLTPVAVQCGRRLAMREIGQMQDQQMDFRYIPTVVFTHPPIATVGLTESQARSKFNKVSVYTTDFTPMIQAFSENSSTTYIKVICKGDEEEVVGIHAIGSNVDEMLQGFAVAIRKNITKKDLDKTIAIHPTSSEEIVTLKPIR